MRILLLADAVIAAVIGVLVLSGNPKRLSNRALAGFFFLVVAWLLCVWSAWVSKTAAVAWLRANIVITSFLPWCMWLVKESIVQRCATAQTILRRSLPWVGMGLIMSTLSFLEGFYVDDYGGTHQRGTAYFVFIVIEGAAYVEILRQAYVARRAQTGVQRIELQFLVIGMGGGCLTAVILAGLGSLLQSALIRSIVFPLSLLLFGICAWAITIHRILNVRQVFLDIGPKVIVVALVVVGGVCLQPLLADLMSAPLDLALSILIAAFLAWWFDQRFRAWLDLTAEQTLASMRREIIESARTQPTPDRLVAAFESLLQKWCETPVAQLLFDDGPAHASHSLTLEKSRPAHVALRELSWATPEALQRRRTTPLSDDLARFFTEHHLGLLITAPRGSPTPSLLVAIGTKRSDAPFTYPEVERLQNIAELMDNILSHSRLAIQAALQTRMEHLAMLSRGLAHDMKNLLTPVASFLVHTDGRYAPDSVEAEVHSAARHSVRVMTDYLREALFFSERLAPRFEPVELGQLCRAVREVTAERAAARGVRVESSIDFADAITADGILLQRMLGNLVWNAIDASAHGQTVTVRVSNGIIGTIRFQVLDHGIGITSENLGRIFEPYFTTKEFGDDVRGFGLGLTICQKIANLHGGKIGVESEVGRGTIMTVDLPVTPPARLLPAQPCLALP